MFLQHQQRLKSECSLNNQPRSKPDTPLPPSRTEMVASRISLTLVTHSITSYEAKAISSPRPLHRLLQTIQEEPRSILLPSMAEQVLGRPTLSRQSATMLLVIERQSVSSTSQAKS